MRNASYQDGNVDCHADPARKSAAMPSARPMRILAPIRVTGSVRACAAVRMAAAISIVVIAFVFALPMQALAESTGTPPSNPEWTAPESESGIGEIVVIEDEPIPGAPEASASEGGTSTAAPLPAASVQGGLEPEAVTTQAAVSAVAGKSAPSEGTLPASSTPSAGTMPAASTPELPATSGIPLAVPVASGVTTALAGLWMRRRR